MLAEMTVVDERATLLYRSSAGATESRRGGGQGGDTTKSKETVLHQYEPNTEIRDRDR